MYEGVGLRCDGGIHDHVKGPGYHQGQRQCEVLKRQHGQCMVQKTLNRFGSNRDGGKHKQDFE